MQYRRQLLARDAWERSTLEHALTCGRSQVFEVVYEAIRDDIYDDEVRMPTVSRPVTKLNKLQVARVTA